MAKPKGWSPTRVSRRDRLAKRLTKTKSTSSSYAIATAALSPKRVPRLKKKKS